MLAWTESNEKQTKGENFLIVYTHNPHNLLVNFLSFLIFINTSLIPKGTRGSAPHSYPYHIKKLVLQCSKRKFRLNYISRKKKHKKDVSLFSSTHRSISLHFCFKKIRKTIRYLLYLLYFKKLVQVTVN